MKRRSAKYKMMAAFSLLLRDYEYDDITVSMITDYCGVSRQAFYKMFDNKQDLCAQMIVTLYRDSIKGNRTFTWSQLMDAYVGELNSYMDFFHTLSTEKFEKMAHDAIFSHLQKLCCAMAQYRTEKSLDEDLINVISCYCAGIAFSFMSIIKRGVTPEREKVVQQLVLAMPQMLRNILLGYSFPIEVHQNTFPGKDENGLRVFSDCVKELNDMKETEAAE